MPSFSVKSSNARFTWSFSLLSSPPVFGYQYQTNPFSYSTIQIPSKVAHVNIFFSKNMLSLKSHHFEGTNRNEAKLLCCLQAHKCFYCYLYIYMSRNPLEARDPRKMALRLATGLQLEPENSHGRLTRRFRTDKEPLRRECRACRHESLLWCADLSKGTNGSLKRKSHSWIITTTSE